MNNCVLCGYCCTKNDCNSKLNLSKKKFVCDFIIRANPEKNKYSIFFCRKDKLSKKNICKYLDNPLRKKILVITSKKKSI